MKKITTLTVMLLALLLLAVSCNEPGAGIPDQSDIDTVIKTKEQLMATIPGLVVPPAEGLKTLDADTKALIKSAFAQYNEDFDEGKEMGNTFTGMDLMLFGNGASGFISSKWVNHGNDIQEEFQNVDVTINGTRIKVDNLYTKTNTVDGTPVQESGTATVNGKEVTVEEAIKAYNDATSNPPEGVSYTTTSYYVETTDYREGTWGFITGIGYNPEPVQLGSSMIMDIKVDGHRLQFKYTNAEWNKRYEEGTTVIDYVAVDGVFYNPKDF